MTREQIIEQVKNLYRLAESTTSENETRAAIAAAERIIQKYRVTEAEVKSNSSSFTNDVFWDGPAMPKWQVGLLNVLGKNYGCYVFSCKGRNVQAVGDPNDVAFMRIQFDRIVDQIDRLTLRECKGRGKSYATSYRKGVVVTVIATLVNSAHLARQDQSSTALVKIDSRAAEAKAFTEGHLGKAIAIAPKAALVNAEAFRKGQRDGKLIHTGAYLDDGKGKLKLTE